jgi:hypothetical protein
MKPFGFDCSLIDAYACFSRSFKSKPPAVAPMIAMLWLSACTTAGSDVQAPCPPAVEYSATDQVRAAAEISGMPEGAMAVRMLSDYADLRDQVRACMCLPGRAPNRQEVQGLWTIG